jgi:hypothetical protein
MADEVAPGSKFLLLARSLPDLEDTRAMLAGKPNLAVDVRSVDNATAGSDDFDACIDAALAGEDIGRCSQKLCPS